MGDNADAGSDHGGHTPKLIPLSLFLSNPHCYSLPTFSTCLPSLPFSAVTISGALVYPTELMNDVGRRWALQVHITG